MARIASLRNLGPAMEAGFARAGIDSAETLRELGADAAYRRFVAAGARPHFIAYLALLAALQDRHWNSFDKPEKAALRRRFDALLSGDPLPETESAGPQPGDADTQSPQDALPPALAAELDALGLPNRPRK